MYTVYVFRSKFKLFANPLRWPTVVSYNAYEETSYTHSKVLYPDTIEACNLHSVFTHARQIFDEISDISLGFWKTIIHILAQSYRFWSIDLVQIDIHRTDTWQYWPSYLIDQVATLIHLSLELPPNHRGQQQSTSRAREHVYTFHFQSAQNVNPIVHRIHIQRL